MQIDHAGSWRRGPHDDRYADEEHSGERKESDLQEGISVLFVRYGNVSFRFGSSWIPHGSGIFGIFDAI